MLWRFSCFVSALCAGALLASPAQRVFAASLAAGLQALGAAS